MNTFLIKLKSSFFLALCMVSASTFAQESMIQRVDVTVHKNNQLGVFVEGGFNIPFTDVQDPQPGRVFGMGASFSPLSYIQIAFNVQNGKLIEGRRQKPYSDMNYSNSYAYTALIGRISPFKIFKRPDEGIVKYLDGYCGFGLGLIFNHVSTGSVDAASYGKLNNYNGIAFLLPYEIGYTLPVYTFSKDKREISLNVNYRNHVSFSDKLDGYVPTVEVNKSNDIFNQLTFGIVYSF